MEKSPLYSFLIFFLYRLSSVFIMQTSYVPDEYWQSLEVAHRMVFGYGYLTWEWKQGIRSYLYPSFFALLYKVLEFFRIDSVYLIILVPRILQALLTAVSDQYFLLLCRNFGFDDYWAKTYVFTNWFWYYCGCRTITNTFETSLTTITLYYFPWHLFLRKTKGKEKSNDKIFSETKNTSLKYMTLSGMNCIVRPTAVTIWGPFIMFHLSATPFKQWKHLFFNCILPVFLGLFCVSLSIDFFWYGRIIIPAYNFVVFNIFKDVSSFYGTHPFFWYFSQGLPAILGLHVLPFTLGLMLLLRQFFTKKSFLLKRVCIIWVLIIAFNIIILSIVPHKEFRFAMPLLPLMSLISVKCSSDFFSSSRYLKFIWTFLLILAFIIPSIIFGIFHQRGSLQLMNYFSKTAADCSPNCLFLFLMPCHSTPLYSHLHMNVSTKFLTCEPPINDNFYVESEDFFNNPVVWLSKYWNDKHPPSHVAFFDKLESSIKFFLESKNFTKKHVFLHSVLAEKNSGEYIVLYETS